MTVIPYPETRERIEDWKSDPRVLGVLQVGSRSRGHGDDISDDDLEVVLTDEAGGGLGPLESIEVRLVQDAQPPRALFEAQYLPLAEFDRKAASPLDIDHWPYERAAIWFDRDGRVAEAVRRCAQMEPAFRAARLRNGTLDALIALKRGEKTARRGYLAPVRLLSSKAARALARVLFALEWRWVPLDHWFEHEVATLQDRPGAAPLLLEGVRTGEIAPLAECLARLENALEAEGIPRDLAGRRAMIFDLLHPSRREERTVHGID